MDGEVGAHTDLFELKDSSSTDVFSWLHLHRHKHSSVVELQDLNPELQPAGHFTPPAQHTTKHKAQGGKSDIFGALTNIIEQNTIQYFIQAT